VNIIALIEWTCGICHKSIDRTLIYPDHGYRSIDHVIPLSLGGEHTYDNARIAHWICNVRRGAARGESL
jgi:5-methylcytosine-specific restriction endonuclease McrA